MSEFNYRKSSYSDDREECVEIATNVPHAIAIRDSKDPGGPILRLAPAAWTLFRNAVTEGQFAGGHRRKVQRPALSVPTEVGAVVTTH
ncbi:DUF397 domain-containing protein [Streptomyces chattanoogensis]|uniref:DUF397 domain-containing protein n=1 Tax=Streptomyces chattanoogensis TaxID=66876 RepID=UPI0036B77048